MKKEKKVAQIHELIEEVVLTGHSCGQDSLENHEIQEQDFMNNVGVLLNHGVKISNLDEIRKCYV